jgi:hypothetical protein
LSLTEASEALGRTVEKAAKHRQADGTAAPHFRAPTKKYGQQSRVGRLGHPVGRE